MVLRIKISSTLDKESIINGILTKGGSMFRLCCDYRAHLFRWALFFCIKKALHGRHAEQQDELNALRRHQGKGVRGNQPLLKGLNILLDTS